MRKHTPTVSASTPTSQPLVTQHTHEVIIRRAGSTVVIRCYSLEAAETEALFQERHGEIVEIVEVGQ